MKFFDLHCDTVQKIIEAGYDFDASPDLHISLPGIISSNLAAQVFACFVHGSGRFDNPFHACNAYIDAIENLIKTILYHNNFYQNDELRIYPKKQSELWREGFDTEGNKYTGSKWGKYLRAPEIFFKILEKGKDKLVPLKEIADVRFGIKTGANEFFYLTEEEIEEKGIEKEFWMHKDEDGEWIPNKVIVSPREVNSVVINPEDLSKVVLFINKGKEKLKNKN